MVFKAQFVPPKDIVKSTNDGEQDYSMVKEGFVAYANKAYLNSNWLLVSIR
jgi:hypothetical protein